MNNDVISTAKQSYVKPVVTVLGAMTDLTQLVKGSV